MEKWVKYFIAYVQINNFFVLWAHPRGVPWLQVVGANTTILIWLRIII
jgi:bifunctional pyridoxal-dependent enzyme with beta-cystathionase and maltose regulon repressor activities